MSFKKKEKIKWYQETIQYITTNKIKIHKVK